MRISIDARKATGLVRNVEKQLAFAVARTINATLTVAQREERDLVAARFTLRRRTWVLQSVKISRFATKQSLRAEFGIDPTRDVLAKFERGGPKVTDGSRIAVPLSGVQPSPTSVVRAAVRPSRLGAKAFVLKTRTGRELLVQRLKRRSRGAGRLRLDPALKALYSLRHSVQLPPRLQLVRTTITTFARRLATQFALEFARAIRTAR